MARSDIAGRRNIRSGSKVKTGCATCRIRKVKCDENKPFCRKCVSTGRACDGYNSPFRVCTTQAISKNHRGDVNSDVKLQTIQPNLTEITPQEIDHLNRYFSIKTIFNVNLACDEEARQILEAGLTDPSIRYAISSLRALREDFETSGYDPESIPQKTSSYSYGIQQYNMALSGLVSNLSSQGYMGLSSALLCCQVFISIEQVQQNYTAMVQHIIRGLRIMHEYRARPQLTSSNKLMLAHNDQLPLLDVFIIKLFAAPCKFADPTATAYFSGTTSSVSLVSPQQPFESQGLRTIAPDMRTDLTRIAASTQTFLSKVSQVESVEDALQLLPEKAALLNSLESWLINLELVQVEIGSPGPEPISVSFMRLSHTILKIIILGTLGSSPDLDAELQTESDRCQSIAKSLSERLKVDRMCNGTSSRQVEQSQVVLNKVGGNIEWHTV